MVMKGHVTPPEVRAKISAALKGRRHTDDEKRKIALAGQRNSTAHQATRLPTTRELEWAAGFIEGEGSLRRGLRGEVIKVAHVDPEPLSRLLELFGGRVRRYERKATDPAKWSNYWEWTVNGARARGVMMTLFSLLSFKRQQQIKAALQA